MNQNNQQQPKQASNSGESLRERLKKELTQELPEELMSQIAASPDKKASALPQNQSLERGKSIQPETQTKPGKEQEARRLHLKRQEETTNLRLAEKREVRQEIAAVRKEIEKLAANINQAAQQAEKNKITTASQQVSEAENSQYHFNFFQLLLEYLKDLQQKVAEGNTWLQAFQKRHQKKNPFWNNVKQSGAKFLLAPDRTPSTQAA